MYTSHGHHIPGTPSDGESKPENVARCGGPKLCAQCGHEAMTYILEEKVAVPSPLLSSFETKIHQIPPAPMSDEDLRLESIRMAVELACAVVNIQQVGMDFIVEYAEAFQLYIRPKTD